MQKIFFSSGKEKIAGNLLLPQSKNPPGVLILHGGGIATKERFIDLQNALLEKEIASLAIDFCGVGDSTGNFEDGSLSVRLENARDSLKELKKHVNTNHIGVFGSSMGGYVASLLAEKEKVSAVVISSAAAYSPEAENKKLNNEFTKVITKPRSWEHSKSFRELEIFKGKLMVFYGQYDAVIPYEIQERYGKIAQQKGAYVIVENGSHTFMAPKNGEEEKRKRFVINEICRFLSDSFSV